MKGVSWGLIVGVTVGVVIGILLATIALFCNWLRKRNPQIGNSSSRRASTVPIRTNGVDTCTILSDSTTGQESPRIPEENSISLWIEGPKRKGVISVSGIPKYAYKRRKQFVRVVGNEVAISSDAAASSLQSQMRSEQQNCINFKQ